MEAELNNEKDYVGNQVVNSKEEVVRERRNVAIG